MQNMVLQIVCSNFYAHLKYFEITNEVVLGVKEIVQVSTFHMSIWFWNETLTF